MSMLKTFNAQSDYGFKQIQPDGSTVAVTMTGCVPADLTPEAFAEAAKNPASEVSAIQKRGKLKTTGREISAKRTEITGSDAAALFAELLGSPVNPPANPDAEESPANGRLQTA